ncbi:hypothetical protein ISN45_At04g020560 [Arabidopsis thaliana x Arabidopsis arenosa]|uniref:Uncharacterized protein n=1 Tax=Arabidopsis thaliana x Arabidopsis arenosa TaxID=1240361 RepID=A0A8T2DZA8_9BRAS|nr:hypothetical protein ISN45_At04g020560 [Arabidopsis thaliana x Arabidopsis arenosa]
MTPLLTVSCVTSDTVDASTSSLDKTPSEEESPSNFKCSVSEAMEVSLVVVSTRSLDESPIGEENLSGFE